MKSDDLDKRLSAYLDGALADAKRERFERELESDAALQKQMKRSQALSGLVREAWSEGPVAPTPDFLIASIRPHLAAISRERRARPAWQQSLELARQRFADWWSPMPLATSAVAAFLLAVVFLPRNESPLANLGAQLLTTAPAATSAPVPAYPNSTPVSSSTSSWRAPRLAPSNLFAPASLSSDGAASIYDYDQGENSGMLLQNEDGSTVLWLLDDDDLSLLLARADRWG